MSRPLKKSKLMKEMDEYLNALKEKQNEYHDDPVSYDVDEETGDVIIGAGGLTLVFTPDEQE